MAVRRLKDGRWAVYYRDRTTGKLKWEYFGRGPTGENAAWKRHRDLGLLVRRPAAKAYYGPTFRDLALAYIDMHPLAPSTRYGLACRLDANILPMLGDKPALNISYDDLDRYVAQRRRDGVRYSTIRRGVLDIKTILSWGAKRRPPLIPYQPVAGYAPPKADEEIIQPPRPDELRAILAHARPHLARAILLCYYLGVRPGPVELSPLRWQDVDWTREVVHVRSAHKGGPVRREVPIHPHLLAKMRAWFEQDGKDTRLHIVRWGHRPVSNLRKAWKKALENADITRRLRLYDLRHAFVTQALAGGGDLKAVADIAGSDPRTILKTYQHVSSAMKRQAVAVITPLGDYTKYSRKSNSTPS